MDNKAQFKSGPMKAISVETLAIHHAGEPKKWYGLLMLSASVILIATVLAFLDNFFQSQK